MKKTIESFPLGNSSTSCGDKVFQWLISPVDIQQFTTQSWEKKPIIIKRDQPDYFSGIISRRTIENYVKTSEDFAPESLVFTRDTEDGDQEVVSEKPLDVDSFTTMLDCEGWSAQLIHPQQRNAKLHALLERLENFTGSLWGCNVHLGGTPQNTSFRGMSDNVDMFVMQMEGDIHWKVFSPSQLLSRDTDSDLTDASELGPPILDESVSPGDMIYIPRGFIHSHTPSSGPYLYVTVSTYQNQSWCDLLSSVFSETLESETRTDVRFREGLPFGWISMFGSAVDETEKNSTARSEVRRKIKSYLSSLIDKLDDHLDEVIDQFGSDFIALRTPPILRKFAGKKSTESVSTFGPDPRKSGRDLKIRIRNPMWIRVVIEDEKTVIFSALENEIANHMKTDNPMECDPASMEIHGTKTADGMKQLISVWPEFLPIDVLSQDVAGELWECGILESMDNAKERRVE
jgi:bifunctional lysine-specific demethylase and histidyl-hydroxylase NO66